jgi:hypothetical protein
VLPREVWNPTDLAERHFGVVAVEQRLCLDHDVIRARRMTHVGVRQAPIRNHANAVAMSDTLGDDRSD